MKAKELAEILLKYPDYNVKCLMFDNDGEDEFLVRWVDVNEDCIDINTPTNVYRDIYIGKDL